MRNVVFYASKLNLVIGSTINITLIDSIGRACTTPSGYALNSDIVVASERMEIPLMPNELTTFSTQYKITLGNGTRFYFTVPSAPFGETLPHDMLALLRIGCTREIIDHASGELDEKFLQKLGAFFMGMDAHFTPTQEDVVALYVYYADNVLTETATIDIMKKMDLFLATIEEGE